MTERRFDEDQFAEILRRAAEMQTRLPARTDARESDETGGGTGMSLSDIRAIAAEVGIDPELVTKAAAIVADDSGAAEGASERWVLSTSSAGTLTEEDKLRIVRAIRDAAAMHGDADLAGAGMEWKSESSEVTRTLVTVEPLDGRNELRVSTDASVALALSRLFPTMAGGLTGVAIGASTEPGLVAGIAIVGAAATAGFGVGELIWRRIRAGAVARSRKILAAAAAALPLPSDSED